MSEFNLGDPPLTTKDLPKKANQNDAPTRPRLSLSIKESTPPEPEKVLTPPVSGISDAPADALPDFENAPLPDDEAQPAEPIGEGAVGKITPSGMITYEIFDDGFCKAFMLAGHATGLQTLAQAPAQPARPDATRAMYDIILDTPALHWLLQPQSLWMQRILAISMFGLPVASGVAAEIRQRQAARKPAPEKAAPEENKQADMRAALKGKKP